MEPVGGTMTEGQAAGIIFVFGFFFGAIFMRLFQ